jgi:hypothetical protein
MWRSVEFREKLGYAAYDQMLDFILDHGLRPGKYRVVRSEHSGDSDRYQRYALSYWEEEPAPLSSDVA